MKRYVSGFLFFFILTAGALLGLFYLTKGMESEGTREIQVVETIEHPAFAEEETSMEPVIHVVLNQKQVTSNVSPDKFLLVAEEGYLIVYDKTEDSVNLFTHMPLSEFPIVEQERLMEGIWFPTMAEIFSYLESYTS